MPARPIRSPKMIAPWRGMVCRQMRRARGGDLRAQPNTLGVCSSPQAISLASVSRGDRSFAPVEQIVDAELNSGNPLLDVDPWDLF
jgi:hypothetical protein